MLIIGCDYHPSWQQICWLETTTGETGGVVPKVIVCRPVSTVKDCCTGAAGPNSPPPRWTASIVQVPRPEKVTVDPSTRHTEVVEEESVTGSPDVLCAVTS